LTDFAVMPVDMASPEPAIGQSSAQLEKAEDGDREARRFRRLVEWARARGGRVGAVTLVTDNGLRGLGLASDVSAGEEILFVPRSCWLSETSLLQGDPEQLATDAIGDVSPRSRLAWLLCDGGSPRYDDWRLYLDALPSGFESHPLGCEEALLQYLPWLAGPAIREMRAQMRWDHQALCNAHPARSHPDYERFAKACCCVASRAFADNGPHPNLIPLADLLNHSFQPTCGLFKDAEGAHIVAKQDLRAGTALTWQYADVPNVILLGVYGFCVEDHPRDRTVVCGPAITDELALRFCAASKSMESMRRWVMDVPAAFGDAKSRKMLTAMRSIRRDPFRRDDGAGPQDPGEDPQAGTPANRDEELAVLRELRCLCDKWATDLDERSAPPVDAGAPARAIADMSGLLVRSNRRIVDHFSRLCDSAIPLLSSDDVAAARAGLAAFPDADYAAELLAHADLLWPPKHELSR
jgi:hypothetical protein